MPRLIRIADGIYRDSVTGALKHRPIINGRRTERSFVATTLTKARQELAALKMAQLNSRIHGGADPYGKPTYIEELAKLWLDKNCPDRKDLARTGASLEAEKAKLLRALPFWKTKAADTITLRDCKQYYHWRTRQSKRFKLSRSVDTELNTLSNCLDWAVSEELIRVNPIGHRRPRFDDPEKVRHCTEVMPPSDEIFHEYARYLLASNRSRNLGWQMLLEGLTGHRTSEILACRLDAKELPGGKGEPGYCDGHRLHVKRAKKGINPFSLLDATPGHSPLRDCLNAFYAWHDKTFAKIKTPWFIPGRAPMEPIDRCSLTHALKRARREINKTRQPENQLPEITSHGLRAYFVKTMRSLGVIDQEISARLGHRSTDQVEQTYGTVESDWFGQRKMDFLPSAGKPAWAPWLPKPDKKVIPITKALRSKPARPTKNHGRYLVDSQNRPSSAPTATTVETLINKA